MLSSSGPLTAAEFEDLLADAQHGLLVDDSGASAAVDQALHDVAATELGPARDTAVANARAVFAVERTS